MYDLDVDFISMCFFSQLLSSHLTDEKNQSIKSWRRLPWLMPPRREETRNWYLTLDPKVSAVSYCTDASVLKFNVIIEHRHHFQESAHMYRTLNYGQVLALNAITESKKVRFLLSHLKKRAGKTKHKGSWKFSGLIPLNIVSFFFFLSIQNMSEVSMWLFEQRWKFIGWRDPQGPVIW